MVRLILVLGDQLTDTVAALREGDPSEDVVVMAEVTAEAGYVPHHPKKIAFCFAAMRHFRPGCFASPHRRLDHDLLR